MQTQRAKAIIGVAIFATGAALAWRGVTVWRGHGHGQRGVWPAIMTGRSLPPTDDAELLEGLEDVTFDIDPAAMSIDSATAALERALRERGLDPPPGEPADVWRPRMLELAQRVPARMQAIWRLDADALASLARETGATRELDISTLAPELRNMALLLGNMWRDQWGMRPASSEVRVRWSNPERWFNSPFAPPTVSVRNPFRIQLSKEMVEELPPDALLCEALIPVDVEAETPEMAVDGVMLGFMYLWSEEESRWMLFGTTVYHRHGGGGVVVGAPP